MKFTVGSLSVVLEFAHLVCTLGRFNIDTFVINLPIVVCTLVEVFVYGCICSIQSVLKYSRSY